MAALLDRLGNEVREWRAIAVFLDQYIIKACISAKRPYDVMGIAGKTDAAQMIQIIEFPFHMMRSGLRGMTWATTKEFSDNAGLAALVFVEVDLVGGGKFVYPEFGSIGPYAAAE